MRKYISNIASVSPLCEFPEMEDSWKIVHFPPLLKQQDYYRDFSPLHLIRRLKELSIASEAADKTNRHDYNEKKAHLIRIYYLSLFSPLRG